MKSNEKKLSHAPSKSETQKTESRSEIVIYRTEDGSAKIDVRMENETVWLPQAQIARLFGRDRSVVTKHIRNIFAEGELEEKSNVQNLHVPILKTADSVCAFDGMGARC